MNDDVVEVRDLRRSYRVGGRTVTALDGVRLSFGRGTFTAVTGPSGSGKSTLLQCAAGLERPTSGSVLIGGTDITRLRESRLTRLRRDRVGFVFQAYNLLPALTAEQNVALPFRLAGRRPAPAQLRAALAAVGLADRAHHRPAALSGGQQQRVALARAIATHPDVLFADEPTGALDARTAEEVLGLLRQMTTEGHTVVMVTHDPSAAAHADTTLTLTSGRLLSPAPPG
ncbi:ABC transporter ATP-binding protein [Streptomyces sp. NBC_01198]|uniref:ABC transporter ATP-binding protein n=1 Tax=Streptomyces sp. NBC_01198 TaxID=2903769 RepID=UPI002E10E962|nr:ABC transporter ATP-binding protein [Streptomyces sp. NBC_01198]